ncbi:hypothetical protein A2783_01550 [Microgenomates group bacterium RIFCSPHIGHO2_01_FULL_45_11]|nr:MAG: hypothetical protein A2783_01550 [Microgenomates group bacterium RIFCSPHIGHO2_01_FULL_45_11]
MEKKSFPYFFILIRSWNCYRNLLKSINSALKQDYRNFKILFIDDASNYSNKQKNVIKKKLKSHIAVFNSKRKFAVCNAYYLLKNFADKKNAVVLNLDGDDWLLDTSVLSYLSMVYQKSPHCLLTWGECVFWNGKTYSKPSRLIKPYTNISYPLKVVKESSYRRYPFLPLHPRTWKVSVFNQIKKASFLRPDGTWLQFAEDQALFYPMLEMARGRYKVIKKPLYAHNTTTKLSDAKINLTQLLKDELIIRKRKSYEKFKQTA